MMEGLASEEAAPKSVVIGATYLKAHRTATTPASHKRASAGKVINVIQHGQ